MHPSIELPKIDPRLIYAHKLKEIKRDLPSICTFLAPYKVEGKTYTKAIINKESVYYPVPEDFQMTAQDYEVLKERLLKRCQDEQREG